MVRMRTGSLRHPPWASPTGDGTTVRRRAGRRNRSAVWANAARRAPAHLVSWEFTGKDRAGRGRMALRPKG
ncbi:hypothetical protein GCM10010315_11200 [Streptomyces luteosporeus]|uniref:Uncharacterized protein n=1 Tax=Streptomyces luteosporeus TaxID=173856 RepID=A0ABN3TLE4_9ACTN